MEQKTKILSMLSEGKINVEETEKLLGAIGQSEKNRESTLSSDPKFFNILVEANGDKQTRVKVKIPFRLLNAGIKFVNLIPETSREKIQKAIQSKGMSFDLHELSAMKADELVEALKDLEVSVVDGDSKESVRIFCA